MIQVFGRLKTAESDQPSFTNCNVMASVDRRSDLSPSGSLSSPESTDENIEIPPTSFQVSALSNETGDFTLAFPDEPDLAEMTVLIEVLSPLNDSIFKLEHEGSTLKGRGRNEPIILVVKKFDVLPIGSTELEPPPTRYIRGRIIDRKGKSLPQCLQILLLGCAHDASSDELALILVTKSDSAGYFGGTIDNQKYNRVVALVSGFPDQIGIRLVESRIPPHIPIIVEFPDQAKGSSASDCKCSDTSSVPRTPTQEEIEEMCGVFSADLGTNKCIRFNVPNRAIEEFNFYSVVRTSDPIIRGITLNLPDSEVAIPTIPPAQGEEDSMPGGGPTPAPTSDPVLVKTIRGAIIVALSGSSRLGTRHDWTNVEQLIRGAVSNVRGTSGQDLSETFFLQFYGEDWGAGVFWGQGTVWGEGHDVNGGWKIRDLTQKYWPTILDAASLAGASSPNPQVDATASRTVNLNDTVAAISHVSVGSSSPKLENGSQSYQPLRVPLDGNNQVDWDDTPTIYQAVSVAHGHLLQFRQVWYADGYSLGDLIQSLPLAPGQKKQIMVIDWERREETARDEFAHAEEGLNAALVRDRDLREVVSATLSESSRGESHNKTEGFGVGKGSAVSGSYEGFNFGGVMGVSGGFGNSGTTALQRSARDLTSSSLQTLRDRTLQSASAVRSQRSTIVQTAVQGETVRATTEVIANHNHCHALTIQYFEVLRHFKVTNELSNVQECLFVPLPMEAFNRQKVLRWRESLLRYLKRPELEPAIKASERIETDWKKEYAPLARYADEHISALFGELTITIFIPLPPFPEKPKPKPGEILQQTEAELRKAVAPAEGFFRILGAVATLGASEAVRATMDGTIGVTRSLVQGSHALAESLYNEPSPEERYARFQQEVMPTAAAGFIDQLQLYALVADTEKALEGADFTLVSEYRPGSPLLVSVRGKIRASLTRANISAVVIKSGVPLPPGCRVIVNSASIRYQTKNFRHEMVNEPHINDDIDLPIVAATETPTALPTLPIPPITLPVGFPKNWIQIPGVTPIRNGIGAMIYTPLDEWEQKAPRLEDIRLSAELLTHLNENLEYYHHALWWAMDPSRRYMLLDRYIAPNANGRSIASVVENTLIGIVGNSLILPVAPGNRLDPTPLAANKTLLEHYDPQSPAPPSRVSLPTRGVFAEAVMGDCNACEEIDDTRFWRWEDSPIDEPPTIDMSALSSRRTEPNYGTPTPFPTPIVNIQNAPQAPDAAGVNTALDTLAKQSFADITGLAGTQANAAAAYATAMDTALAFGQEASKLAQQAAMTKNIGQTMRAIDKAEGENKIDEGDAKQLRTSALKTMAGHTPSDPKAASVADRLKVVDEEQAKGNLTTDQAATRRTEILRGLNPEEMARVGESEAVTAAIRDIPPANISSIETKDGTGAGTTIKVVGKSDSPGGGPIPLRWLNELIMGATGSTVGSEPTIQEAKAAGQKLPTRRLSEMNPSKLLNTMSSADRQEWYKSQLGPFSKQVLESAKASKIPPQLLASVILSELADMNLADIVQEMAFVSNGSLGIAQIQISTAVGENLFPDIGLLEMDKAYEEFTMSGVPGTPTSTVDSLVYGFLMTPNEKRRLAVNIRLRTPQYAIDGAAKLIRLHLQRAANKRANSWATDFGFTWPGRALADPQDIYTFISGINQKDKEGELAAMVEGIHNTPSIVLATTIAPDFENARAMAQTANEIANDLFDFSLFRPE